MGNERPADICITADYTASGIHIFGAGDGKYNNNTVSEMVYPFELGLSTDTESSAPGADEQQVRGRSSVGRRQYRCMLAADRLPNPVNIMIHPGSTGNTFQDTYDDNGLIALAATKNNTFVNTHFTYDATKTLLKGRFDLIAQAAPDSFQGEIEPPSGVNGGTLLLLVVCDGSGGNFWSLSPSMCSTETGNTYGTTTIDTLGTDVLNLGWQVGMNVADNDGDVPANTTISTIASNGLSMTISHAATGSHTGDTIYVGTMTTAGRNIVTFESGWTAVSDSVEIVHHFASAESVAGIGFDATFANSCESSITQNGANNLSFNVCANPGALEITADGNISFPGTPPTCTSGCDSGPVTASGSNIDGSVTAGASPVSPAVISFANQGTGAHAWASTSHCQVQIPAHPLYLASFGVTEDAITVALGTFPAGLIIQWQCFRGT